MTIYAILIRSKSGNTNIIHSYYKDHIKTCEVLKTVRVEYPSYHGYATTVEDVNVVE